MTYIFGLISLWTTLSTLRSIRIYKKRKMSLPADLGIPRSPSQASGLCIICSISSDQQQPGSACPLWIRKPGAASGGRPCASRASRWYGFIINFRRWNCRNFKFNRRIRLWFKQMCGSSYRSTTYPGSWTSKKAVSAGATDSDKLTDTKET